MLYLEAVVSVAITQDNYIIIVNKPPPTTVSFFTKIVVSRFIAKNVMALDFGDTILLLRNTTQPPITLGKPHVNKSDFAKSFDDAFISGRGSLL